MTPPMSPRLRPDNNRKFHGPRMGILAMLIMLLPTARSILPPLPKYGPCGEQPPITAHCGFDSAIALPMPEELSCPNLKIGPDDSPMPLPITMLGPTAPKFRPGRHSDATPARPAATPGTKVDLGTYDPPEFQQPTQSSDRHISDPTRPKFGPELPPATPVMSLSVTPPGPSSTAGPRFLARAPFPLKS